MLPSLVAEYARAEPRVARSAAETRRVESGAHRGRARAAERGERVREHRARPPRDLRALRDRAGDGHEPRRRRTRWRSSRRSCRRSCRGRAARCSCTSRTATTLTCRFAAGVDAPRLLNATLAVGEGLSGWVARNRPHARQRRPARQRSRRPGIAEPTHAELGDRLPAVLRRRVHRLPRAVPHRAEPLHRGSPPAARARRRAGRRRHPQLDRVRADAGRLADRSADRPAEPAVDVRPPRRASCRAPSA